MRPFETTPQAAGFVSPLSDTARPVAVVDDNLDDKEFLRDEIGFLFGEAPIITFFSGNALITYLQGHPCEQDLPRMILLDLHMTGLDGLRTLEFLRREPKFSDIPVIVVSGTQDKGKVRAALAAGAQAFLPKPVSRRDFMDVLHGRTPDFTETRI